ncbi:hypothetical protein OHB54_12390 [Streptomyces sp. NBC_01007]|nr:hypothetical protein OHB54_12390 [Streptomyces sp. NBC_01007]
MPGQSGQLLRGAGTDDCITAQGDEAQFQPCDNDSGNSRWIIAGGGDATVQIRSAADPTRCLFRSGPMATVKDCDSPHAGFGTPYWAFRLAS